jgi:hypothetical protein
MRVLLKKSASGPITRQYFKPAADLNPVEAVVANREFCDPYPAFCILRRRFGALPKRGRKKLIAGGIPDTAFSSRDLRVQTDFRPE